MKRNYLILAGPARCYLLAPVPSQPTAICVSECPFWIHRIGFRSSRHYLEDGVGGGAEVVPGCCVPAAEGAPGFTCCRLLIRVSTGIVSREG